MDKCEFSEFSYGYCVTESLIAALGAPLNAAPVFPSLVQEGALGYDVALEKPGTPLFLQFKLVHQMVRGNANETKKGHFQPPFYRMHLRSAAISDQHRSLLALEQAGNEVFYVAPNFHTIANLNTAYAQGRVWDQSFRLRPGRIGPLPNEKEHHVAFQQPGGWQFYSEEPSRHGRVPESEEITSELLSTIAARGTRNLREQIVELDVSLQNIVRARNTVRRPDERVDVQELGEHIDPLRRVAYLARQFFDCQLLFVTLR